MTTRRICVYGAPSSGKSTSAAFLFSEFKRRKLGPSVELVQEYVKRYAWTGRTIRPEDQLYVFAEQLRLEEELLHAGVDLIITDSPIWLSVYYGEKIQCPYTAEIQAICEKYDKKYPALNIYIDRADRKFDPRGRYQNEAEAKSMDLDLLVFLSANKIRHETSISEDFEGLWETTIDELVKTNTIQLKEDLH